MENKRMVMIPGPTPVVKSIQDQMGREIQAFGDPRFVKDYKELIEGLGKLMNCSGKTFPLAGTGTLAMEMAISNVTKRGDNVLIIRHGYFGDRFNELCTRKGLNVDVLAGEEGKVVPVDEIDRKLSEKHYAAITVTHVDTATGVCAPIAEIGEMMKKHPEIGYEIMSSMGNEIEGLLEGIRNHHERFDGRGYPANLSGEKIPWVARIISVADAFDAMSSTRPYRKRLTGDAILKEIKDCSGTQFDPVVAKAFLELYEEGVFSDIKTE